MMQEKENSLGTEPIGKLIFKYSIPTAFTLMVNYFYNIVDQIFIGQGVGVTGMAATNVSMPFITISSAAALLLGDGCAAGMSLNLGRKDQEEADRIVSHTITMLIVSGMILAIVYSIFAAKIVRVFGATDSSFLDALWYARIIILGLPFLMISISLTAIIRADGNPRYTMKCMIVGSVINLILDPVFIFGLDMGVIGAGIATIIGEIVAGILCFRYLWHLKSVHIQKAALQPEKDRTKRILALGFPSFLTQIMGAAVQIVMNNLMTFYGASSVYGSDLALSVYGMIMKIYQIAHSMFVGIAAATQPINGYNFGARSYVRVRKTYWMAVRIAFAISVLWFLIYQIFPVQIGSLFVSDNPMYLDCSRHFFRLYTITFFIYGIHMVTASFFQGIGKPSRSLMIPLLRQGVFLIPSALFLSSKFGLDGALIAVPIADLFASGLALVFVTSEFKKWKKQHWLEKGEKNI